MLFLWDPMAERLVNLKTQARWSPELSSNVSHLTAYVKGHNDPRKSCVISCSPLWQINFVLSAHPPSQNIFICVHHDYLSVTLLSPYSILVAGSWCSRSKLKSSLGVILCISFSCLPDIWYAANAAGTWIPTVVIVQAALYTPEPLALCVLENRQWLLYPTDLDSGSPCFLSSSMEWAHLGLSILLRPAGVSHGIWSCGNYERLNIVHFAQCPRAAKAAFSRASSPYN